MQGLRVGNLPDLALGMSAANLADLAWEVQGVSGNQIKLPDI
jgi:hypothetical protein